MRERFPIDLGSQLRRLRLEEAEVREVERVGDGDGPKGSQSVPGCGSEADWECDGGLG